VKPAPILAAIAVALLALASSASATAPKTEITDIEDEVMCPICGTLLELSDSPQAQRERVFISRLIADGRTKGQIKDALVAQYGPRVLALPHGSGFNLSAYLVPVIGFLVAAAAVALAALRWRRSSGRDGPPPAADGPQGEDAERLEADLARYDL
jgi:cytochrome c-type biogenesis protein CcmH